MITNDQAIIRGADIVQIIQFEPDVDIKQAGSSFKGCCPFHAENTPSFTVNPSRQTYKCFGCGAGGDVADFVQRKRDLSYPEALEYIAKNSGIRPEYDKSIDREQYLAQRKSEGDQRDNLLKIHQQVMDAWTPLAWPDGMPDGDQDVDIDGRKWKASTVKAFHILPMPKGASWNAKFPKKDLNILGLLVEGKHGPYEPMDGRIIFPVLDRNREVKGFSARRHSTQPEKAPKYINSASSPAYRKDRELFGMWQAHKYMLKSRIAYLVEGATDVVTMFDFGFPEAIAPCGTALSEHQAKIIARHCDKVVILRDGDAAGIAAARRDIPVLLAAGASVDIAVLDEGHDPDSFLRAHTEKGFREFLINHQQDAIMWAVAEKLGNGEQPQQRNAATDTAAELLAFLPSDQLRDEYINQLTTRGSKLGKRTLTDAVKANIEKSLTKRFLTPSQEQTLMQYGFYEKDNCYYVSNEVTSAGRAVSNFVVKPIMLVVGVAESSRIVEITNEAGYGKMVVVPSDDFITLAGFRKAVESEGNYLFRGTEADFMKVKSFIYDSMDSCHQVTKLGYHNAGFYTWGNGISTEEGFKRADEWGVVSYNAEKYWLPAFSKVNLERRMSDDDNGYEDHYAFCHPEDSNECWSLREWCQQVKRVHLDNGAFGTIYLMAAIYRDIVFRDLSAFPLLNLYGEPGAGKNYLANSLLAAFGTPKSPYMLHSGTEVGLTRRLAQVRNGLACVDEYNNQVRDSKIQKLKSVYDGTGHEKGVATMDMRTVTNKPSSALMMLGQEMPVMDPALFTRCITLVVKKRSFDKADIEASRRLKEYESKARLPIIVGQMLKYRKDVEAQFPEALREIKGGLQSLLTKEELRHERVILNYATVIAVWSIVDALDPTGYKLSEVIDFAVENMRQQISNMGEEDDRGLFWRMFEVNYQKGEIRMGDHFRLNSVYELNVQHTGKVVFDKRQDVLLVYMAPIQQAYAEAIKRINRNPLPFGTLKNYLQNNDAYIGSIKARLKENGPVTSCMAFKLDRLGLDITFETNQSDGVQYADSSVDSEGKMPF